MAFIISIAGSGLPTTAFVGGVAKEISDAARNKSPNSSQNDVQAVFVSGYARSVEIESQLA